MMVEFYRHGARCPNTFDAFLHDDGRMSFDHRKPTKGYFRVVVELTAGRPNPNQTSAIYHVISKHKVCTVAFYDFELPRRLLSDGTIKPGEHHAKPSVLLAQLIRQKDLKSPVFIFKHAQIAMI